MPYLDQFKVLELKLAKMRASTDIPERRAEINNLLTPIVILTSALMEGETVAKYELERTLDELRERIKGLEEDDEIPDSGVKDIANRDTDPSPITERSPHWEDEEPELFI